MLAAKDGLCSCFLKAQGVRGRPPNALEVLETRNTIRFLFGRWGIKGFHKYVPTAGKASERVLRTEAGTGGKAPC